MIGPIRDAGSFLFFAVLFCAVLAAGVPVARGDSPGTAVLENDRVRVEVDLATGRFDVLFEGRTALRQAAAGINRAGETGEAVIAADDGVERGHALEVFPDGRRALTVVHPGTGDRGTLQQRFEVEATQGGLTVDLAYTPCPLDTHLLSLFPVYVGPELAGSGLYVGENPWEHRVLQNGSDVFMDMAVRLLPGGLPQQQDPALGDPSLYSNWNSLIRDLPSGWQLLAGFLTFERMAGGIYTACKNTGSPLPDGRLPFSDFVVYSKFIEGRDVSSWDAMWAETLYLDVTQGSPHQALEGYADRVAARNQIVLPAAVPSGWNSWYWYYESLDQQKILDNLIALSDRFGDFGLDNLQIDMGWYAWWGDWEAHPVRFLSGMEWLMLAVRALGLLPELWIAPFLSVEGSQLLAEHPDWVAETHTWGPLPEDWKVLDLTRPEVLAFLQQTAARLRTWGVENVKFDFAYPALLLKNAYDPDVTNIQAFRNAIRIFKSGLGPGGTFTNILMTGPNMGLVDIMRIGLDSWPCWGDVEGEECPYAEVTTGPMAMGLRPSVRTLARRYYFHGRTWITHPDQVFFRDFLSLEAQRAWATLVGLSGGVVCLGDQATTLSADGEDIFRRLLPVLGRAARPVDLFEREYPEVWHLDLSDLPLPGHVIGIFNWGSNLDLGTVPYAAVPEEARDYSIDLERLGISGPHWGFEYWSQTPIGLVEGSVGWNIPARDCRLLILRPAEDHPQVVSSNRHVSQGATDLQDVAWNAGANSLCWRQRVVAGFPHKVRLTRLGFPGLHVAVAGGDAAVQVRWLDDDFFELEIAAEQTGEIQVEAFYNYCFDQDQDGYGLPPNILCAFTEPDCDDSDPQVHPGMPEVLGNGVDDDCNPETSDDLLWNVPTPPAEAAPPGPGPSTAGASRRFNALCWIGLAAAAVVWKRRRAARRVR